MANLDEDDGIPSRTAEIISARRQRLPAVRSAISRWQEITAYLSELEHAIAGLAEQPAVPDGTREALAARADLDRINRDVTNLNADLQALQSRLTRETLNIGVSGQARVGKSTFLQAITGLGDGEIPTGSGLPVTAVRSRIVHSTTVSAARLHRRTPATLLTDVVGPYYQALGLTRQPLSLDEFAADASLANVDVKGTDASVSLLDELRKMQRSLATYRDDLRGDIQDVSLAELRPFVAYPGDDDIKRERAGAIISRRYLAIDDVRIFCRFPHPGVDRIGLVDLPGLGEVAPNAEEHHLDGLQHEVDVVLMIVRPAGESAFWNAPAERALQLVKRVCGTYVDPRDFAFIVINDDGTRPDLIDALSGSILDKVNEGVDDRYHIVLKANAGDSADVFSRVLSPVLRHLAANVGAIDARLIKAISERGEQAAALISAYLDGIERLLRSVPTASSAQLVDTQTEALRKRLAAALGGVRDHYRVQAAQIDEKYEVAVAAVYDDVTDWISRGFGVGQEQWCTEALAWIRLHRNSAPYAVEELNRIRVELATRFRALDDYFTGEVEQLLARIEQVLADELGMLISVPPEGSAKPGDQLRTLQERLEEAAEPCLHLARTVADLTALSLDYRSHVYPWIADRLRDLNFEEQSADGQSYTRFVVPQDGEGARTLLSRVTEAAEGAAYNTRSALLDGNIRPAAVLWAAAEYFEDAFLRAGPSEPEFRSLGRSYQNEIWPGVFAEMSPQNAHLSRVRGLTREIRDKTKDIRL